MSNPIGRRSKKSVTPNRALMATAVVAAGLAGADIAPPRPVIVNTPPPTMNVAPRPRPDAGVEVNDPNKLDGGVKARFPRDGVMCAHAKSPGSVSCGEASDHERRERTGKARKKRRLADANLGRRTTLSCPSRPFVGFVVQESFGQ